MLEDVVVFALWRTSSVFHSANTQTYVRSALYFESMLTSVALFLWATDAFSILFCLSTATLGLRTSPFCTLGIKRWNALSSTEWQRRSFYHRTRSQCYVSTMHLSLQKELLRNIRKLMESHTRRQYQMPRHRTELQNGPTEQLYQ
jgi:hypothetical protein